MATRIQLRRDTNTNWSGTNPTLSDGEPGYDKTRNIYKVGDGATTWANLGPANTHADFGATTDDAISFRVSGDAYPRFVVDADGTLRWGSGASAPDTDLFRQQPGWIRTNSHFELGGVLRHTNVKSIDTQFGIQSQGAARIGAVVRGAASQTANLQEWQNSAGTTIARVSNNGNFVAESSAMYFRSNAASAARIYFGAGDDTNLYRAEANILKTDDTFEISSGNSLKFSGNIQMDWATSRILETSGTQGLIVRPYANTYKALSVRGHASQSANLQEWQDSAGTVLGSISSTGFFNTTGSIRSTASGAGAQAISSLISGEGAVRWEALGDGKLQWGDGVGARDTNLYREAANTLKTDDFLHVGGAIKSNAGTAIDGQLVAQNAVTSRVGAIIRGVASQTANLQEWQNSAGTVVARVAPGGQLSIIAKEMLVRDTASNPLGGFDADGTLRYWAAGLEQTTVGAAGAASALPANPTKYLKVKDSAGATLVIPAFAAA